MTPFLTQDLALNREGCNFSISSSSRSPLLAKVPKRPHMSTRRRPRRSAAQATAGAAAPAVADIPVDPALDDLLDPHSSSDDDHPGEDDYATQDDDDEDDYRTNSRGGQQHGHQQSQQQQQQQGQQGQASQQGKKRSTGVGSRTAATAWAPEGMRRSLLSSYMLTKANPLPLALSQASALAA